MSCSLDSDSTVVEATATTSEISPPSPQKRKRNDNTVAMDSFVSKSTPVQQRLFDDQIARFIYATNSAFQTVEHPEFIKMVKLFHPEYSSPTRKQIAGDLLENTYRKEKEKCTNILNNETVTLGLDGWSNIHNEPVICATVMTKDGNSYLADTIDTSDTAHTAENLHDIAVKSIKKCQSEFHCFIHSVVTDNAKNVSKMRSLLGESEEFSSIITYGCAAHVLSLLANDIRYPNVTEQILLVIKYFRNNQYANACFKKYENVSKLTMPSEVRWNSYADALEKYLNSWSVLVSICESNRDKIDKHIQSLVSNISLKRNAEYYLEQLKPISVALDKVQRKNCSIGETVSIFKDLKKKMHDLKLNKDVLEKIDIRYKMAITPAHLLAYLLDPKTKDADLELSPDEKKEALEYAKRQFPQNGLLTVVLKFCAKSSPFQKYLFETEFVQDISTVEWWQMQENDLKTKFNADVLKEIEIILTAKSTTANVERIFSTFGFVHSKLRNRLGIEKAAKLVFLYQMLNLNYNASA